MSSILPLVLDDVCYEAGGERLIDSVSFALQADGCTVMLGPNGSGKSLTLRLCHGLIPPSSGTVRWTGPDAARARRRQAMVFQRPVMLRRSALANVTYALSLARVPGGERRDRAEAALARVGLGPVAHRPARALSGGEQQRLALARAWALEPEVLFLDEPTSSLDPAATHAVEEVVRAIAESGTKIVMTTHALDQARRLAHEVLFLHGGRLVERAPAEAFFQSPQSPEAQAVLRGDLYW